MNPSRIISFQTPEGGGVSLNADQIALITPDKIIARTVIGFIGGSVIVDAPYTTVLRMWTAAREGKTIIEAGRDN